MIDGHFLGGMAENEIALRQQDTENAKLKLAQDNAIFERQKAAQAAIREQGNKTLDGLIGTIEETTKSLRAAGRSQEEIEAAIEPLAVRTARFGGKFGQDTDLLLARIGSIIGRPSEPQTDLGKLEADRRAGFIDEGTYRAKLDEIGKGSTTINVNNASESAFAKKIGEGLGEDLLHRRNAAEDAITSIQSTDEALKLLNSGAITGAYADYIVAFGKGLQAIGINFAEDEIANSEAFIATRAQEVARVIKLFGAGTGLSDADREFAEKAAAGKITMTEQSIRKILDINARASRKIIQSYNNDAAALFDESIVPWGLALPEVPNPTDADPIYGVDGKTRFKKVDGQWRPIIGGGK